MKILVPWRGNAPDLNPVKNSWLSLEIRVDKQKRTNSAKLQAFMTQEWTAVSQDWAQELIDSMPGRIAEEHCK